VPGIFSLSNSKVTPTIRQHYYKKEINSLYGTANFSYNNAIYLNLTTRNDWSSTLPIDNNSYFYPSVGLSFLGNELIEMPSFVSFTKLRFAFAQVGKDTSPYQLQNAMVRNADYNETLIYSVNSKLANKDLKPEMTDSYEVGVNAELFNYRFSVDATYYYMKTKNQIVDVELAAETAFGAAVMNAGSIENKGVELMVSGVPVKTKNFEWELGVSFAKNKNELTELNDELDLDSKKIANYVWGGPQVILIINRKPKNQVL
jgi:outer membrane receptor protein involved in Fe transport